MQYAITVFLMQITTHTEPIFCRPSFSFFARDQYVTERNILLIEYETYFKNKDNKMYIYLKQTILVKEILIHCEFIDNFYKVI